MKYGFLRTAAVSPDLKVADPEYNARQIAEIIGAQEEAGAARME